VDICAALDLSNATKALKGIDDDETNTLKSLKGQKLNIRDSPKYNIVSLPGVIRLVWHSHKPGAKRFRRWVTHEVLPQIRKTCKYNPDD
jgi:anti-repressor protein